MHRGIRRAVIIGVILGTALVLSVLSGCRDGGAKPQFHLNCYVIEGENVIVVDAGSVTNGVTTLVCEGLGIQEIFTEGTTFEFPVEYFGTYTFVVSYEHTPPDPRHNPFYIPQYSSDNVCFVEVESVPAFPPSRDKPCWEADPPNRWGHRKVSVCVDGRTRLLPPPAACNLVEQGKATFGVCDEND